MFLVKLGQQWSIFRIRPIFWTAISIRALAFAFVGVFEELFAYKRKKILKSPPTSEGFPKILQCSNLTCHIYSETAAHALHD